MNQEGKSPYSLDAVQWFFVVTRALPYRVELSYEEIHRLIAAIEINLVRKKEDDS